MTINQILKNKRKKKRLKKKSALQNCPQKSGLCKKFFVVTPRKPNSALRKIAKINLSTGKTILAYVPGEKTIILENSKLLIRGGNTKDLPGLKYKVVLGALDARGSKRQNKRSKYGIKKPKPTLK
ncbi:30S ribosomal protein S12, putative (apicoplast) [Theileria equi strain WA]|uniref:30S ribosomal protein S12, putative n=1 Tax=Theileria equi strain WA TaxID=1537102 RepID=L1L9V4_THEEQ|nr:30S ribosomal protein S12, putative [Theileria equi strain WA]EKX71955.1 30S ribosomal protein S12, putative [Theileria equi strain WA]|eukprot:XP_025033548.1 30S ribosomal protein S12, putative (apicoplast) [Theileria equi strain WA]